MSQPLLLIYGQGGHCREMSLLLDYLSVEPFEVVTIGPQSLIFPDAVVHLAHYRGDDVRDKHSRLMTLLLLVPTNLRLLFNTWRVFRRFNLAGVVSTGPGLAILPMLLLRLLGVKTVFIETNCRFTSRSMTGRVMSKIAHRFLVQNKQLLALYPDAQYCGRL